MVDAPREGSHQFVVSHAELLRRRSAFDRLALATLVTAALASGDLIARNLPGSLGGVLVLVVLFLLSRAGLARAFRQFACTVWTVSRGSLRRTDARSDATYSLRTIRSLRTKLTTSGTIREMRVGFDDGRTVYVNALEQMDAFRSLLADRAAVSLRSTEVRESIDFDAPWFYLVLGSVCGLAVATAVRLAATSSGLDARLVFGACAAYSLGTGTYWLRAKPLAGRFGQPAVVADRVFGALMICVALLGFLAMMFARPV